MNVFLTQALDLCFPWVKEGPQSLVNFALDLVTQYLQVKEYLNGLDDSIHVSSVKGFLEPLLWLIDQLLPHPFQEVDLLFDQGYLG